MADNDIEKIDKIKIRRSCIPSKDNSPEEITNWLKTFSVCKIVVLNNYYLFNLNFTFRNGQMWKEC